MGTGIEIDRGAVEIFAKTTLFPAKNLVFRKKSATIPGSVIEIKRF